jgi:hypothetical protein
MLTLGIGFADFDDVLRNVAESLEQNVVTPRVRRPRLDARAGSDTVLPIAGERSVRYILKNRDSRRCIAVCWVGWDSWEPLVVSGREPKIVVHLRRLRRWPWRAVPAQVTWEVSRIWAAPISPGD